MKKPFERELLKNENPAGKSDVAKHADPRWYFNNGGNGLVVVAALFTYIKQEIFSDGE